MSVFSVRTGKGVVLCAAVGLVVLCPCESGAAPLGLSQSFSDITSTSLVVTYSATGLLEVTGNVSTYATSSMSSTNVTGGTGKYTITVTLNTADGSVVDGSPGLSIGGSVGAYGDPLLGGTVTDFGFENVMVGPIPATRFEFLIDVTGGSLQSGFGSQAGVVLLARSTAAFSPGAPYSNVAGPFLNSADTFPVVTPIPEPSSGLIWALLALSASGLYQRYRHRHPV